MLRHMSLRSLKTRTSVIMRMDLLLYSSASSIRSPIVKRFRAARARNRTRRACWLVRSPGMTAPALLVFCLKYMYVPLLGSQELRLSRFSLQSGLSSCKCCVLGITSDSDEVATGVFLQTLPPPSAHPRSLADIFLANSSEVSWRMRSLIPDLSGAGRALHNRCGSLSGNQAVRRLLHHHVTDIESDRPDPIKVSQVCFCVGLAFSSFAHSLLLIFFRR